MALPLKHLSNYKLAVAATPRKYAPQKLLEIQKKKKKKSFQRHRLFSEGESHHHDKLTQAKSLLEPRLEW